MYAKEYLEWENWCKRSVIADALRALGLHEVARNVLKEKTTIDQYLSIIVKLTDRRKDGRILENLYREGISLKGVE